MKPLTWFTAWAPPTLFLFWGLLTLFYSSLITGFELLPGDNRDGRLNHYFLEHGWRWISGNPLHSSFWDAPFFYPHDNVMGWSDILLGSAPFYWAARLLGFDAFSSYLVWTFCLGVLNYLTMFLFLRRAMAFSSLTSALGAFLFAFCAVRLLKTLHIQMMPQFYSVLFMWCVHAAYRNSQTDMFRSRLFMLGAALCFVLQFYAGFYLGWFLAFGVGVFLGVGLCIEETRCQIRKLVQLHYPWLLFCLILTLLLLFPMAKNYLQAKIIMGGRSFDEAYLHMPSMRNWLDTPAVIYEKLGLISAGAAINRERLMGIGFGTLMCCIFGLYKFRRTGPWGRCLVWSLLIVFLLSLNIFEGVLWRFLVFSWVPGASSIRAVARISLLVLLILPIGLAYSFENKKPLVKALFVLLCLMESFNIGYFRYDRSRVHRVSAAIAAEAAKYVGPFVYLSPHLNISENNLRQLARMATGTDAGWAALSPFFTTRTRMSVGTDAMWASLIADRPTINGHSGFEPHGYETIREVDPYNPSVSQYLAGLEGEFLMIFQSPDGAMTSRIVQGSDFAPTQISQDPQ